MDYKKIFNKNNNNIKNNNINICKSESELTKNNQIQTLKESNCKNLSTLITFDSTHRNFTPFNI